MSGETLQFSTSAIRSYTGPTGGTGEPLTGTGGTAGPTGPDGAQGGVGGIGSTGFMLKSTYYDENTQHHKLVFGDFTENEIHVGPTGLTGGSGYVIGATPSFYNVGSQYAVVTGATWGTVIGPGTHPHWTEGISGSTLSFRKLGVSGDLVFYTDESKKIGAGPTYDMIGISGPVASVQYGTVTGQSVGELGYLTDKINVKDAHGLTFNENATIASAGFVAGGLTWGSIRTKFYSTTNHFHVHGNVVQGVVNSNFIINNNQSSVHIIHTPFFLRGITYDKHAEKKPISVAPPWDGEKYGISGATANYGEATTATLVIKNGPLGANFSNNFYFPENSNQLGEGTNIINCLSYDEGVSWLCGVVGTNFGYTGTIEDVMTLGSCCDSTIDSETYGDCKEFLSNDECDDLGDTYTFYDETNCAETPCSDIITELGSCCVNKDPDTGEAYCLGTVKEEECNIFGGIWRTGIPCGSAWPCGDPCDEDFGIVGACCKFDENGHYILCEDDITEEDCILYDGDGQGHYGIYGGDYSYCNNTNCCDFTAKVGACCVDLGMCSDSVTPKQCNDLGGLYQGHNTVCGSIVCSCDPEFKPGDCINPDEVGICCNGCNPTGCNDICTCQECQDAGGEYLGQGSCAGDTCGDLGKLPGACCWSEEDTFDECQVMSEANCGTLSGEWLGTETTCSQCDGYVAVGSCCCSASVNGCVGEYPGTSECVDDVTIQECGELYPDGSVNDGVGGAGPQWVEDHECQDYCNVVGTPNECCPTWCGGWSCPGGYCDSGLVCIDGCCKSCMDCADSQCDLDNGYECIELYGAGIHCCVYTGIPGGGAGNDFAGDPTDPTIGSCMIYPTENSCIPKLEFGCIATNSMRCSDINKFFETNELGWNTVFNTTVCCAYNHDPTGSLDMTEYNLNSINCQEDGTRNIYNYDIEDGIRLTDCDVRDCSSCSAYCNTRNTGCGEICDICNGNSFRSMALGVECSQGGWGTEGCWIETPNGGGPSELRTGACCSLEVKGRDVGECKDTTESRCQSLKGLFLGVGTSCRNHGCPTVDPCFYVTVTCCTEDPPPPFVATNCIPQRCSCNLPEESCAECEDRCRRELNCKSRNGFFMECVSIGVCEYDPEERSNRPENNLPLTSSPSYVKYNSGKSAVGPHYRIFKEQKHGRPFYKKGIAKNKTRLSGVVCVDSDCKLIEDLYEEIKYNKEILSHPFYPFIADIYNRLNHGSVFVNNPKEHFIKMYTVGGHGITRPMTAEEIYTVHRDDTKRYKLTLDDIILMIISYEVEQTFMNKDSCICDIINTSDIELKSPSITFVNVPSPLDGINKISLIVPSGAEDRVSRMLGGTNEVVSRLYKNNRIKTRQRESQLISLKTMSRIPPETLGNCRLPDNSRITSDKQMCNTLNGIFTSLDYNFISNEYIRNTGLSGKTFKYVKDNIRSLNDNPTSALAPHDDTIKPGPIFEPDNPGPCTSCINTCCPEECMSCIFDAIREAETGDPNTPGPNGLPSDPVLPSGQENSVTLGCNGVNKRDPDPGTPRSACTEPYDLKKKRKCWSCGPYQLKYGFFKDAAKANHPDCRGLKNLNWHDEMCKPCTGTPEQIITCCKRKKELSQLVIKCYWRHYTRNGTCQSGNGPCGGDDWINPEGNCFTCEDLVRQHNRGLCGHNNPESKKRWNAVKKIMCESGNCSGCCETTSDCGTRTHDPVPDSCCPNDSVPDVLKSAFNIDGYWPLFETAKQAKEASPTPLETRDIYDKRKGWYGYHEMVLNGKTYYMPNGLVMGDTQFHGDFAGSPVQILLGIQKRAEGEHQLLPYTECTKTNEVLSETCVESCNSWYREQVDSVWPFPTLPLIPDGEVFSSQPTSGSFMWPAKCGGGTDHSQGWFNPHGPAPEHNLSRCMQMCSCKSKLRAHNCWRWWGGKPQAMLNGNYPPLLEEYPGPWCNAIKDACRPCQSNPLGSPVLWEDWPMEGCGQPPMQPSHDLDNRGGSDLKKSSGGGTRRNPTSNSSSRSSSSSSNSMGSGY